MITGKYLTGKSIIAPIEKLKNSQWSRILGMNARNFYVDLENPHSSTRLVNSKYATKTALESAGVPVVSTFSVVRDLRELANFDWDSLPDSWALKPNRGRRGAGIMLAKERDGLAWRTASGRVLTRPAITSHIRYIFDGEYSLDSVERDWALFEPLIIPHPELARLVPSGLPDIRVICYRWEPVLAMMRLPTGMSEGRANLHQGAIGAAVDLNTGIVWHALFKKQEISHHPDTGKLLIGVDVPYWDEVLDAATRCGSATGLGYLGVDIVIDEERGPLVLEVNARPGLEIQNVTGIGLADVMHGISGR